MRAEGGRLCLLASFASLALAGPSPAAGQTPPGTLGDAGGPAAGATRFRLDARAAFLVTRGQGHSDRPVLEAGAAIVLVRARGGLPGVALLGSAAVGFGEIFAEAQSESLRLLAGVELPFRLRAPQPGRAPIELVPAIQAGRLTSNGEDERDGFTARAGMGLRVPVAGRLALSFEPIALVVLPEPDDAPVGYGSRLAFELGFLRLGWRF